MGNIILLNNRIWRFDQDKTTCTQQRSVAIKWRSESEVYWERNDTRDATAPATMGQKCMMLLLRYYDTYSYCCGISRRGDREEGEKREKGKGGQEEREKKKKKTISYIEYISIIYIFVHVIYDNRNTNTTSTSARVLPPICWLVVVGCLFIVAIVLFAKKEITCGRELLLCVSPPIPPYISTTLLLGE